MAGSDTNHDVSLSLANPQTSIRAENLLRLEQEEWGKHVGTVTKTDIVNFVAAMLYGGNRMPVMDCGINDDGSISCLIYAYPKVKDLNYKLRVSYGVLSLGRKTEIEESEGLVFLGNDTANLKYDARSIIKKTWHGKVFLPDGTRIHSRPDITISDDGNLKLSFAVNATLVIEYKVERHEYILTVIPRPGAKENKYSSVVYGFYDYGIVWIDTNAPNGADGFNEETECGWGTTSTIDPNDPDDPDNRPYDPPECPHDDRETIKDYCTQNVISDSIE